MTNKICGKLNSILRKVVIIVPVLYACIMYISNCMRYSESDDGMMNNIARGNFTGKTDEHLIFINTAYGYLTKALYKISHSINWYVIIYLFLIVLCAYLIWFIVGKYTNYWIGFCVAIALESFCIFYLTFTIIAFVCSFTGLLLLIDFANTEGNYSVTRKILVGIAIVVTCCFGFIIRKEPFLVTVFLFIPLLFKNIKKIIKSKNAIVIIASVLVGVVILNFVNSISYNTPLWKEYTKYNMARSKLIDYPVASYEENRKFYKAKGISKNDLDCARTWTFGDKTVFSEKTLNEIVENTPFNIRYNFNPLTYRVETLYKFDAIICYLSLIGFLMMTIYAIVSFKNRRKYYLIQSMVTIFYLAYLGVIGRTVVRVVLPAILIACALIIYSIITNKELRKIVKKRFNKKIVYSILVLVLCGSIVAFNYLVVNRNKQAAERDPENQQIRQYVRTHKDCLFLIGFRELVLNMPLNKKTDDDIYPNLMQTGDQDIYNNLYYQQMEQLNVRDEYKDRLLMNLLHRDNTFMLAGEYKKNKRLRRVRLFLEEHSKRKIECRAVEKIKGTNTYVYQFK